VAFGFQHEAVHAHRIHDIPERIPDPLYGIAHGMGTPLPSTLRRSAGEGEACVGAMIPLVESSGPEDPNNAALLERQLEWMVASSRSYCSIYRVARGACDLIAAAKTDAEKLPALRALGALLAQRPVERGEPVLELQP